jgi:hypothetical protein
MINCVCVETEEFDVMAQTNNRGAVMDGEFASEGDKVR